MNQMGAVRPGGVGVGLGALGAEQERKDRVTVDPFAGMKAGENRDFRGFNANQVGDPTMGGMTVISGPASSGIASANQLMTQGMTADQATKLVGIGAEADLAKVRTRLLPEEAAAQNKLTLAQALQSGALTNKTNVEAEWLPKTLAAGIDQTRATTRKLNTESDWYGPVAKAGIGLTNAQARDVGFQQRVQEMLAGKPSSIFSDELGMEVGPNGELRRRGLGLR